MSKKKAKGVKPGAPQETLQLIQEFRSTEEGDPDRGHFSNIVQAAIKGRVMTKEDTGLSAEMTSRALQGMPTGAHPTVRASAIETIETAALACLTNDNLS